VFEVGREYEFRIIEGAGETSFRGTIAEYEHPLIKLADPPAGTFVGEGLEEEPIEFNALPRAGRIINVISPHFVSAVEIRE